MAPTLEDLINADTEDERLEFLLTQLAAAGFPTTSWGNLSPTLALQRVVALGLADNVELVATLARAGVLDLLAEPGLEGWLDLVLPGRYGIARTPAAFGLVRARLTRTAASGPDVIAANQLWLVKDGSSPARRYNNTAGGTLGNVVGNTLDLTFLAENAGTAHNLTLGTPVSLNTPLPGVSVALLEASAGSGSPMVASGTDQETPAAAVARAKSRWATIGLQKTADAWSFLAKNAEATGTTEVTKVLVDDTNPRGAGTLDLYLAGSAGAVSEAARALVDAYLQPRAGASASLLVRAATNLPVPIVATVFCKAAYLDAARAQIDALLRAYQAELAIGDGAGAGTIYVTQIGEHLMTPPGVINCLIPGPGGNVVPAKGAIGLLQWTLTGGAPSIVLTPV